MIKDLIFSGSNKHSAMRLAARATRMIFLMSGIAMAGWAPMVPFAQARLNLDDAELGLLLLAFGGGSMVSMPLIGWLAHRYGSAKVIRLAGLMLCLALPGLALAPTMLTLALGLLYFGATLGAVDVAMNAHAVAVERRAGRPLMSGFHGLFSVGGLVGAVGMSALLRAGLPLLACALQTSGVLAIVIVSQARHLLRGVDTVAGHSVVFRLPHGPVLFVGVLCFISFLAEGSMLDWSALLLRDFRGYDGASAGFGYAAFSVAMALGRLTGDRVIARLGPVWTVRSGAVLAAAGILMATLVPWHVSALLGFALVGLGASNLVPVLFSAAGHFPNVSPAIAIAAVTTFGYAGLLLGPALIGFVTHGTSLPTALAAVAGLLLIVAASARIVRR